MQGPLLYLLVMLGLFVLGVEGGEFLLKERPKEPEAVEQPVDEQEPVEGPYSDLNS